MGFFAGVAEQDLSLHMYLLLKLTTALPPYQNARMNTLLKHHFNRQQSVRTGEFSVLFNHKAEHISIGSRYVAYKITLHITVDLVFFSSMIGISLPAHFEIGHILYMSTRFRLRATSRTVAGSFPYALIGPWVFSAPHRNEYKGYLMTGIGGRCVRLTALLPSCADFLDIPGPSISWGPNG